MKSKYNNQPVVVDGFRFDSKMEADRYQDLRLMETLGLIRGLVVHPVYELQRKFRRGSKVVRAIHYEADFMYDELIGGEDWHRVAEDVKGHETAVFKLKQKMFWYNFPGTELRLIKE